MTHDEAVLRTIRMIGFGELSLTSEREWRCCLYEVTKSERQDALATETRRREPASVPSPHWSGNLEGGRCDEPDPRRIAGMVPRRDARFYDNQDELEGQVSARRALTAIGETIGQPCSICRSRHGSEVRHHAE